MTCRGRTTAAHFFIPSDSNALPDILEFSAGSTGNVAPTRTISASATTMSAVGDLALDSAGNIYVLNDLNLLKHAPNATGNVTPIATITSGTTFLKVALLSPSLDVLRGVNYGI